MLFPQPFILDNEICAVQLFGRKLFEPIPKRSLLIADRPSDQPRIIEVSWNGQRYLVFQRDLEEHAYPAS